MGIEQGLKTGKICNAVKKDDMIDGRKWNYQLKNLIIWNF